MKKLMLLFLLITILSGCGNQNVSQEEKKPTGPAYSFKDVKDIHISEDLMSLSKSFEVSVDGKTVATVKGKVLNMFGDKFTLTDTNGNVLESEQQLPRSLRANINRAAVVYDKDNKEIGYFGEELINDLFKPGFKMHFFDANQQEVGYATQNYFSFLRKYHFFGMDGKPDYEINENWSALTDEFDIHVINPNSKIPVESAILMVCIQQVIDEAHKKKE